MSKNMMRPGIYFVFLAIIFLSSIGRGLPAEYSDPEQLEQLELRSMQQKLQLLQNELNQIHWSQRKLPETVGPKVSSELSGALLDQQQIKTQMGSVIADRDSQQNAATNQQTINGQVQQVGQKRVVSWQPMRKRVLSWQPMRKKTIGWKPFKKTSSSADTGSHQFKLSLVADQQDLKDEMVDAIERRLIEDLEAGRKYGIEPRQILDDLRAQNALQRQQSSN